VPSRLIYFRCILSLLLPRFGGLTTLSDEEKLKLIYAHLEKPAQIIISPQYDKFVVAWTEKLCHPITPFFVTTVPDDTNIRHGKQQEPKYMQEGAHIHISSYLVDAFNAGDNPCTELVLICIFLHELAHYLGMIVAIPGKDISRTPPEICGSYLGLSKADPSKHGEGGCYFEDRIFGGRIRPVDWDNDTYVTYSLI
ncbi:hypothetical protein H0H87_010016, partial [Tephrocybe sp. NHM501043]